MSKFFTALDVVPKIETCPGNRYFTKRSGRYREDGTIELVEVGVVDCYKEIQSHKLSCDINNILRRYAMGEVDVLSKVNGVFGDFTDVPKTYADLLNRINSGRELYESMPADVKSKFNNDFNQFCAILGSDEFFERLGVSTPSVDVPTLEVKNEASREVVEDVKE